MTKSIYELWTITDTPIAYEFKEANNGLFK